ncbi:MAG: DUF494 domain-containing protein [Desulfuromonadales bacterium]|nr:DUF494 domain-containing protein [Desulfuromonadales bacterium]NIS41028.1 DUF494 domain-containing protein [Desulfuromonadales bacterium]
MSNAPFSERVLAIVNLIAQYLLGDRDLLDNEQELVEELMAEGFDAEEIDAAFNWMANLEVERDQSQMSFEPPSFRIFTPEERRIFSSEAQGFLIRLRLLGIVDSYMLEEIIERALQGSEDVMTLQELKTITALTVFTRSHDQWRQEFMSILEDDWSRIYH